MSGYDDIHRAARDPVYQMLYDQQRRQESINRQIAQITASSASSSREKSNADSGSSFSFTSSSSSSSSSSFSSSSGASVSGDGGEAAGIIGIAMLGFVGVALIAEYWAVITKWAGLAVFLYAVGHSLVRYRRRVLPWLAAPFMWACWLGLAYWLHIHGKLPIVFAFALAGAGALVIGTAIWPTRRGRLKQRFLAALYWLCIFLLALFTVRFTVPSAILMDWGMQASAWIAFGIAALQAGLVGGALQLARRRFAHHP